MAQPGTTKRVATILWSVGIAVILLVITTAVILPSTKRAHISFGDRERMKRESEAAVAPATQPESWPISSSKSMVLPLDRVRERLEATTAPSTAPSR